ncbi:phage shock protein A, PspA [Rippkaea orientalis PCC 8801]|uniref:Phage shock protein A, PspA n=1 Tax=Rippkaea orientalis (strain PCC 8801 / RF-1) TaxID=41431 RepID=B7K4B0_RIPO1|nr:PspA/IM30 family protein [Rippkaea orientalis]ACK67816.1 phage shock protein A, PspA [Rippkaea orientalis PCC 8801]
MGLFDRLSRVVRANLNDLVSKAEDPEKVLEQTIMDMGEDLVQVRQAVARAIAEQKRTEQRYSQDLSEANKWEQRAKLALSKGDESLAREALVRKKTHAETAATLKQQLDQQAVQVETLRRNLVALESKISEAKTKKNMLIARAKAAKANEEIQSTLGGINTSGSMAAFERMEAKVLDMEARSQAVGELGSYGIEQQFAQLESGSGVEDELAMLKAQISGTAEPAKLPEASSRSSSPKDTVVDAELEELRKQLDNL